MHKSTKSYGKKALILEGDWVTWDAAKYNMMKKTLWSDLRTGKFVGLDHEIPLGSKGETVTAYYR